MIYFCISKLYITIYIALHTELYSTLLFWFSNACFFSESSHPYRTWQFHLCFINSQKQHKDGLDLYCHFTELFMERASSAKAKPISSTTGSCFNPSFLTQPHTCWKADSSNWHFYISKHGTGASNNHSQMSEQEAFSPTSNCWLSVNIKIIRLFLMSSVQGHYN